MTNPASERHQWTVNALDIQPDDRLLEIGCGHGVALSLICQKLTSGSIIAIDRSAKVAAMAQKRNAAHITSGKAAILPQSLLATDFAGRRFDKAFASHVGVFWQDPTPELAVIRDLLLPEGRFYLVFQPLDPAKLRDATDKAVANLVAAGFPIEDTLTESIAGGPIVCLKARPVHSRMHNIDPSRNPCHLCPEIPPPHVIPTQEGSWPSQND